ncbi:hypothetical protein MICRO8M_130119 [Microbacterium sp. 8M]|nr:hypothetical protein MICRO8M_130119 [Microbacterium sp. 8M]
MSSFPLVAARAPTDLQSKNVSIDQPIAPDRSSL